MSHSLPPQLDIYLTRCFFQEAKALFARDGGRLWGRSLDGPMLIVDYETRQAAANQADAEGQLTQRDDIWVGAIPPEVIIANTAMSWAGVHWTVLLWQSIPSDPLWRAQFFAHEAFHCIQDEIGFPMPQIPNANVHLDTVEGRYLLQLEWRALSRALTAPAKEQLEAIGDALLFRAARRARFPQAAAEERALEMHEGLAEYNGFALSGMTRVQVADYIHKAPERYPSFVRSFAYASGPAYGLLLDTINPDWRIGLTPHHDFGTLLQGALNIVLPAQLIETVEQRASAYDGESLLRAEHRRERERQAQIDAYRSRLLDAPALVLPISAQVQCAFDPRTTIPLPEIGTVFPFARVKDEWGVLDLEEGGLLMFNDWTRARISAPLGWEENLLHGEGWTLHLAEGWQVRRSADSKDWELVHHEA